MDAPAALTPLDTTLYQLAALSMRALDVAVRMMELERTAAEAAATVLPAPGHTPATMADAVAAGQAFDTVAATLAQATPHIEILAGAVDRLGRSVRRTVALISRRQAGWPAPSQTSAAAPTTDDRPAMVRRQVARGVADAIRRESDTEAAERLFDDLADRLDDPGLAEEIQALPVEEVVRRICRDLGLTLGAPPPQAFQSPEPGDRTLGPAPPLHPGRGQSSPSPLPQSDRRHPPDA